MQRKEDFRIRNAPLLGTIYSGDDGTPNKEQNAAENSVTPTDTLALEEDADSIEEYLMWPPTGEVPASLSSGNTTEQAETPEQYREEQVSADAAVGEGTERKLTPQLTISGDYPKDLARSACLSNFQSVLVFRGSSNDMAIIYDAHRVVSTEVASQQAPRQYKCIPSVHIINER
ncbi:uncharacterized protein BDR25DRAFT_356209 [Lindgomyces ingoldianus]|uniref:Uncharacterized protein n=1 Tax=Lindgomyces ingoldianus TaxID=673940 RepID=A0ACB6QSI6_9PLEO|nr:uncharacterized protein BDR25DRAFT_356209 [Lindgomyces ingoldianus]KAF2469523.1 hypothetical protein BDR25DRAFT_356209 [Lindgomyces ingoldianus]